MSALAYAQQFQNYVLTDYKFNNIQNLKRVFATETTYSTKEALIRIAGISKTHNIPKPILRTIQDQLLTNSRIIAIATRSKFLPYLILMLPIAQRIELELLLSKYIPTIMSPEPWKWLQVEFTPDEEQKLMIIVNKYVDLASAILNDSETSNPDPHCIPLKPLYNYLRIMVPIYRVTEYEKWLSMDFEKFSSTNDVNPIVFETLPSKKGEPIYVSCKFGETTVIGSGPCELEAKSDAARQLWEISRGGSSMKFKK